MIELNNNNYYHYNEIHQILSIPKANSESFCCFLKHYFYVDGFVRVIPVSAGIEGSISLCATSGNWNSHNANLRDRDQIMLLTEVKVFIRGFVRIETVKIPKNDIMDPSKVKNEELSLFKLTIGDDCYINDELSTVNTSYYISSIKEFKEILFGHNDNEVITLTEYSDEETIDMLSNKRNRFDSEEILYFYRFEDAKKQCKPLGKRIIHPPNINKMIVSANEITSISHKASGLALEPKPPVNEVKPLTKEIELKDKKNTSSNNNSTKLIRRLTITNFVLTNLLGEYSEYQFKNNNLNVSEVGRRAANLLFDIQEYDFEGVTLEKGTFSNNRSEIKKKASIIIKELIQDCIIEIEKNFSKK